MTQLVQCIPNFSEGRNIEVINRLKQIAEEARGVTVLDVTSDEDHNRMSIAMLGAPDKIAEVAFSLVKYATKHINMQEHSGAHPRMGATDVVPFVPVKNISMEACIQLSKTFAERVSEELNVPTFLYEHSASSAERKNLSHIRHGQFEKMADKIKKDEWKPDYGEQRIHPTAGVTAVAARMPLVAFNVNLNTPNVEIAKSIAKIIRESNGGFKDCKAIGLKLAERHMTQVSMDIVNYEVIPLYRVLETIRMEARRYGVDVLGAEVYGIAPAQALIDSAAYYMQLEDFNAEKQVLENRV
ncbi:MAG TPA: glutamate formimidoyltransferase [Bacillota bacterium]|nr:glutamate formimidoyltransferase [Bacillota bacterium]